MIIFLKDIPPDAKKSEILVFIEPVFNDCFLGKTTSTLSFNDIEILSIEDVAVGRLEKHALVRVSPKEVARRVIRRINGKFLKNTRIMAHEYVSRSSLNDRRMAEDNISTDFPDRRLAERRRIPLANAWQENLIKVDRVQNINTRQ